MAWFGKSPMLTWFLLQGTDQTLERSLCSVVYIIPSTRILSGEDFHFQYKCVINSTHILGSLGCRSLVLGTSVCCVFESFGNPLSGGFPTLSTPYLWERFRGGSHHSIFTRFGSFSEGGELGTWSKFQNENPISSASPVKILLREDFQIDLG